MTIREILTEAAAALGAAGIPEHARESSSLAQFALRKDRVFLISNPEYEPNADELARFQNALARRLSREPLQYITGRQEFYGLDLTVTPDVLIPRPETEMLVEKAIELLRDTETPEFAEIGIGSGCISISTLVNATASRAAAVDISPAAIEVARNNAEIHGVSGRLELVESDLFAQFPARRFDLIVSNPPYVPATDLDGLQPEVKSFEPRIALTDGDDGTSIIRRIISGAPAFLKPGGFLVIEIGFDQSPAVSGFLDPAIWTQVEFFPDFQGFPRMLVARL
ncbi:MAG TPA: peptide chain release factor N(5)-glutamine methyltransferase [Pyrinomonadaceae bacterium]|nr:peptide chain release factor N(5)-glutamine methyltransferase [Pyrinomonadaceae bacterium]